MRAHTFSSRGETREKSCAFPINRTVFSARSFSAKCDLSVSCQTLSRNAPEFYVIRMNRRLESHGGAISRDCERRQLNPRTSAVIIIRVACLCDAVVHTGINENMLIDYDLGVIKTQRARLQSNHHRHASLICG